MAAAPTGLGFAYFAGVKLAGYSAYAALLNRMKPVKSAGCELPAFWTGGLVRCGIGIVAGVAYGFGFWLAMQRASIQFTDNYGVTLFFGLLVPIRVAEWLLFLWLLYRSCQLTATQKIVPVAGGIATSFALDAIAVYGLWYIPGAAWIC